MAEIINLNKVKKQKARAEAARTAEANRAKSVAYWNAVRAG